MTTTSNSAERWARHERLFILCVIVALLGIVMRSQERIEKNQERIERKFDTYIAPAWTDEEAIPDAPRTP